LKLTLGGPVEGISEDDKMMALTKFIREGLKAEPAHPKFQRVVQNLFSYFHQGVCASMAHKMLNVAGGPGNGVASLDNDTSRITFKLLAFPHPKEGDPAST
jgi:hypothetical protein